MGRYRRDLATRSAAVVLFSLLLLGCENNTSQQTDVDPPSMVRVQLQLNWLPDAQHGGFYAAAHSGLYQAEGLDVTIVPGGPGTAVLPKVAMGRCDFAIANADQVLLARAQQADVIAIFAAMQDSPRCIMVHESSGITSLQEIANMTVALGDGKAFAEYLKSQIPLPGVRIVSYSGTIAKFMSDDNFAQQGYVFSEPIMAEALGGDPRVLMVSDTGFNPYSSVVVTRREIWEQQPDLVRKFVRATRAGWQAYLASPSVANQAIISDNPEIDADTLLKSAKAIKSLCSPPKSTTKLGQMNLERWQTLRNQLIELELISNSAAAAETAFVNVNESKAE